MFFNESKFRKILREEARKSLHEIAPLAVAATALGAAAGYRGYQNTQTRSAGLGLKYQSTTEPDPRLAALETDVRLVLYGGSAISSFFNMTAAAGMFLKDLYFGDGGDFGDMSEASKESIVKYAYDNVKTNALTADGFYDTVKKVFNADPGTAGGGEPQKKASATTEGTDTYFDVLSLIQSKFASGAPAAVDPNAPPAPAPVAGPATDWPSYVAATAGGAAVQAAWRKYAAAMGVNAGFGSFARWYQANAKGLNPSQTAAKLSSLAQQRAAPAGGIGIPAAGAPAAAVVAVTATDTVKHKAEAAEVQAADAAVAAAEADPEPNPLTKKQKIAAAIKARQKARLKLIAARQNVRNAKADRNENLFYSNDSRLNESSRQLKNLKITWGK